MPRTPPSKFSNTPESAAWLRLHPHDGSDAHGGRSHGDPVRAIDAAADRAGEIQSEIDHLHRLALIGARAAAVGHEVNNILTPALAYEQLAKAHPNDHELREKAYRAAMAGLHKASQIAQSMLEFTSPGDDSSNSTHVGDAVQAAIDCLVRQPEQDGIDLDVSIDDAIAVHMSGLALQQVILNLMLNALNVLRGRRGRIVIRAHCESPDRVMITIADNGPGIGEEKLATLFEPWGSAKHDQGCSTWNTATHATGTSWTGPNRPEKNRGIAVGGYGLGLSICRRLVEQWGGTIAVASSSGQGTTFTILLKTVQATRAQAG